MSIWDDPELVQVSEYVKFENIGDTVSGRVLSVIAHRFDDGKVVPKIILETDDGEIALTAGQVRLKAALADQRPEPGDTITVTLTDIEKRAGGKTLKHFDVLVQRGNGAPAAAASDLSPEQKAAVALLASSGIKV